MKNTKTPADPRYPAANKLYAEETPAPTPGPWYEASTGNHQGLIISEATGANVAVAYDKKDAPLIAAAPELLDMLTEARGELVDLNQSENDGGAFLARLDAIVMKATKLP